MRVADCIAEALHQRGTPVVFGLMGEDVADLVEHLHHAGVRYLSSRHESGAVAMADGYARASGGIGVAIVSRGPGFTNALTALTTASRGGSRVLLVAADSAAGMGRDEPVSTWGRISHKLIDESAVLDALGIEHRALGREAPVQDLDAAMRQVAEGRTIVLRCPVDVLASPVTAPATSAAPAIDGPATRSNGGAQAFDADVFDRAIGDVADLLETTWAASAPVIVAGRGAVRAGAGPVLRRLAERIGAAVTTTLPAIAMFRDDPFDLGVMGTFSTPAATEVFGRCDVLLVFGATLNKLTTFGNTLCPQAKVVQFDDDQRAFGRFVEPLLTVHGDCAVAAGHLLAELERRQHRHRGLRTDDVRAVLDTRAELGADRSDGEGVDPRLLVEAIDRVLPVDRTLVIDPGHHMAFQIAHFTHQGAGSVILPLDFGAIGSATAMAVGVALGDPTRLTVLGIVDGGLMMTLGELDTAVRAQVPLLIVVLNDRAYGAEVQIARVKGGDGEVACFDDRPLADVAASLGAESMTLRVLADVGRLAERLAEPLSGVLLVDCRITRAVRAELVDSAVLVR